MKKLTIICDNCKREINDSFNYLSIKQYIGDHISDMLYPEIIEDHHFCDFLCLKKFLFVNEKDA